MTDWITTKKAMQLLGVGPTTIKRWTDKGRLPFTRTAGGHRRFRLSAVERFMQSLGDSANESLDTQKWLNWLQQEDVHFIYEQVLQLRETRGDWFMASDLLNQVFVDIGRRWANGDCSVTEENKMSTKLVQAITAAATSLPIKQPAPKCLLATLTGEQRAHGLYLSQLCMRSVGIDALVAGINVSPESLNVHITDSDDELLALSASTSQTNSLSLRRNYMDIAATCRERDITLILGGEGAWPDDLDYGYRCRSFVELQAVLAEMQLRPGTRLTNH